MKYPANIIDNDRGWGRIHLGHGLDREHLRRDLYAANLEAPPDDDSDIEVDEVYYGYRPRVKWCADYGQPCGQEGDWHGHWYTVHSHRADNAMTIAHWRKAT